MVIATDLAGLDASARVNERFELRLRLGKEPSLLRPAAPHQLAFDIS